MKFGKARLVKEPRATPLKWVAVIVGGALGGLAGYAVLRELGLYYRLPGQSYPQRKTLAEPVSQTPHDYADVRHHMRGMYAKRHPVLEVPEAVTTERLAWEVIAFVLNSAFTYDSRTSNGGTDGARVRWLPEREYGYNQGVKRVLDTLEPLKMLYPWATYADIYALAMVEALRKLGAPDIYWEPGRRDVESGIQSVPQDRVLTTQSSADDIRAAASRMGITEREMVAALGFCHPATQSRRDSFGGSYYKHLLATKWEESKGPDGQLQYVNAEGDTIYPADFALVRDKQLSLIVKEFAYDEEAFDKEYAAAITKIISLGVEPLELEKDESIQ